MLLAAGMNMQTVESRTMGALSDMMDVLARAKQRVFPRTRFILLLHNKLCSSSYVYVSLYSVISADEA
jgi:hypothetical protein